MKLKKLIGLFLCLALIAGIATGCNKKSEEPDYDKIEAQIEEDIIGAWKAESGYMVFFEDGNVGMTNIETGNSTMYSYGIDADVIRIQTDSGITKMTSVKVTEDTLTYTFNGTKHTWNSCPLEEVSAYLD